MEKMMPAEQMPSNGCLKNEQKTAGRRKGRIKKVFLALAFILLSLTGVAGYVWFFQQTQHSPPTQAPSPVQPTGDPLADAIRKGIEFLRVHQEGDGGFSAGLLDPKPAVTALVVESLAHALVPQTPADRLMLDRAAQAILAKQQENGSLCTPGFGLDQYSTSISLMALKALANPQFEPVIRKAKDYLLAIQRSGLEGDLNSGGVGYGAGGRVDGSNTAQWVEALRAAGVPPGSEAFKNAEKFFNRLQNDPEQNKEPAPGTELANDGGFIYRPGQSNPARDRTPSGKIIPKSYGMMSYAGLKSFLFLEVAKDDPRVVSVWKWVKNNYTLQENRNIGADGLFYYYLTMAKALAAYGEPNIVMTDGSVHPWAKELSSHLVRIQKGDGSWRNDASMRWLEGDTVMVTAFAIRTLTICHGFLSDLKGPPSPSPAAP